MKIGTNIPALQAIRGMQTSHSRVAKAISNISSGKKIQKAEDDAAGHAISEKMKLQILGLKTAAKNSLDGVSLIQTGEGALNEVHAIIQRMRELSVQAANDSNTIDERKAIQEEINDLTSEINKISVTTDFNGIKIFNGNDAPKSHAQVVPLSCGGPYIKAIPTANFENITDFSEVYIEMKEGSLTEKIKLNLEGLPPATPPPNTELRDEILIRVQDALGERAYAYYDTAENNLIIESKTVGGDSSLKLTGVEYTPYTNSSLELDGVTGNLEDLTTIETGDEIKIEIKTSGGIRRMSISTDDLTGKTNKDLLDKIKGALGEYADVEWKNNTIELTNKDTSITGEWIKFSGKDYKKLITTGAPVNALTDNLGLADPTEVKSTPEDYTTQATGSINFLEMPEDGSVIKIGTKTIGFYDSTKSDKGGNTIDIDISGKNIIDVVAEVVKMYGEIEDKAAGRYVDPITALAYPPNDAYTEDGLILAQGVDISSKITIISPEKGEVGELYDVIGQIDDKEVPLQFGANAFDMMYLELKELSSKSLRLSSESTYGNARVEGAYYSVLREVHHIPSEAANQYALDVTTQSNANAAIKVYDNAIITVSGVRSKMGAVQNRLERTIANLDSAAENITQSMSRLSDADIAEEFTTFTNQSVVSQAANAMLAQANQLPSMVMKLLEM